MRLSGSGTIVFVPFANAPPPLTPPLLNASLILLNSLRRAAKDILYNDANSSMMNGIGNNTKIIKITPWWQPALRYVIIAVSVLTGLAVLAMLGTKYAYYKKEKGGEKK